MARPLRLRREFNPDRKDHPLGEAKAEAGRMRPLVETRRPFA
jgi:hypothetical protein